MITKSQQLEVLSLLKLPLDTQYQDVAFLLSLPLGEGLRPGEAVERSIYKGYISYNDRLRIAETLATVMQP